ncbi:nonsense-mediated mRNA decay factor SMG5-like [Sminthopsis crassicaudata]|uniref:nonsense-mediated mRNA decay factor SMG5-like n=1 Tax=Sminthopsis crassicaudata TaxID=9301 RepID=UPI003D691DC7
MEPNQTKGLLLKMVGSAQQLDALLARESAHQEVFQPQNAALRSQLEQSAICLILLSPQYYGMVAEELLWRKVYYDLQTLRNTRGALMDAWGPEGAYREHLKNGIHVYHCLFFSMQAQFELQLENYIYWPSSQPGSQARRAGSPSAEEMDWARKFCHLCLLRIGDLYHYLREFTASEGEEQAKLYYYRALSLIPDLGLPFVHLATLSGAKFSYVEATCFYQCCIHSKVPHAAAFLGLEQIYLKIQEEYRQLPSVPLGKLGPEHQAREDVRRLLVSFVYLQSLLTPQGRRHPALERLCARVLEDFQLCLSHLAIQAGQGWARRAGAEQGHGSSLLPNQLVFQMVILCLLTLENLKRAGSELSHTAISFSLVFFSHIVRLVGGNIRAALHSRVAPGRDETQEPEKPWLEEGERGPELPAPHPVSVHVGEFPESDQEPRFSIPPSCPEDSWEDSESMEVWEPDGSRDSPGDSYRVLEDGEDWGDVSFCSLPDSDSSFSEVASEEGEEESASEESAISSSWTLPNSQALQERLDILCAEGLLPALRVVLQWLLTEPALSGLSMRAWPGLWRDLLLLLNLLPSAQELGNPHLGLAPRLRELLPHFERPSPPISMPLLEDTILRSLLPFQAAHASLNFDLDVFPTFSREDVALRACVLRTFGHFAAHLPDSLVVFDPKLGLFLWAVPPSREAREKGAPPRAREGPAQLQRQVQSMETALRLLRIQTALSPYLIPDAVALWQHLPLVREMAQSGRFVLIVPRIVIDELDRRKKEAPARFALRFLEEQLKQRNGRFRCQVQVRGKWRWPKIGGENAAAWNLHSILRGYGELLRAVGEDADSARGMVTVLTALDLAGAGPLSPPLSSAFEAAHEAGVAIEHVLPFYTRWKALSRNTELTGS